MKKLYCTITFVMCLVASAVLAQGPNNSGVYYQQANGKKGAALKTAFFNIIKQTPVLMDTYATGTQTVRAILGTTATAIPVKAQVGTESIVFLRVGSLSQVRWFQISFTCCQQTAM